MVKWHFNQTGIIKLVIHLQIIKKGDIVIAKDVDEKGAKNFALFPNVQTLEQYINSSPEKHFYDCYYFSSKENI